MPVLADCDAFRVLPDDYAGPQLWRHPSGSMLMSVAESANFDLDLVIEQRGLDDEDETALQRFMDEVVRARKPVAAWLDPKIPLPLPAQAQRLIYQANRSNGRQRFKLARRALSLWPDCADAYLFLSQDAEDTEAAIALLESGLAAAERALKTEYEAEEIERLLRAVDPAAPLEDETPLGEAEAASAAEDQEVEFWAQQPTRPYLRVRAELAHALWQKEERTAAIGHLRALLRLCPRDFQGNRYVLAGFLCDAFCVSRSGDERSGAEQSPAAAPILAELGALLERYAMDESAHWLYTRAWWLFQSGQETPASQALHAAFEANRAFPALLIGFEKPEFDFDSLAPGSPEEAVDYLTLCVRAWTDDEAVTHWLLENLARELQRFEQEEGAAGFDPAGLAGLELDDEAAAESSPSHRASWMRGKRLRP